MFPDYENWEKLEWSAMATRYFLLEGFSDVWGPTLHVAWGCLSDSDSRAPRMLWLVSGKCVD